MSSVISDIADSSGERGWIFYDAQCRRCLSLAERSSSLLRRCGFDLVPLQSPWAARCLGFAALEEPAEMYARTRDGRTLGGADALVHLASFFWWAWPLRVFARLPGGMNLLRWCYRAIAKHRHCASGECAVPSRQRWPGWVPLALAPALVTMVVWDASPWVFMWALAGAIFAGCKWLTWWEAATARARAPWWRSLAYLLLWPGMDAAAFLTGRGTQPARREWGWACAKTLFGGVLVWGLVRMVPAESWLLAGWIGMVGLILLLHFGTFHLLALAWRKAGVAADPLMHAPLAARSLSEFWSTRWNRGFNDLAHRHIARPLQSRLGIAGATIMTFLISALVHEAVISLPAGAGYGGPTIYFLAQGAGVLLERSHLGKRAGLRRGFAGRLFALTVAAAPAFWLFHPPFVARVIIPFLEAIGAR